MKVFIKNGRVLLGDKIENTTITICDGIISAIGEDPIEYDKIIDAQNDLMIPGGIDAHTHFDHDMGDFCSVDDFTNGTKIALMGGTTFIIDHIAFGNKSNSCVDTIEKYHKKARDKSYCDYSFHGAIYRSDEKMLEDVLKLKKQGIMSFKIYTTYDEKLDGYEIVEVFKWAKENDILICIHAESDEILHFISEKMKIENRTSVKDFSASRPPLAESASIEQLLNYWEIAEFPSIYFVHVTTKEGILKIVEAKDKNPNVFIETCPQYLLCDEEVYRRKNGELYICNPPLRTKENVEKMWEFIKRGDIDVIASDHCAFFASDKLKYSDNIYNAPGGVPGTEERLSILLSEGKRRGVPLPTLIKMLSTNPACIFGISNRKGTIEIGKDADLVFIKEVNSYRSKNHSKSRYSIYESINRCYEISKVILKGEIVVEKKEFIDNTMNGKFTRRYK